MAYQQFAANLVIHSVRFGTAGRACLKGIAKKWPLRMISTARPAVVFKFRFLPHFSIFIVLVKFVFVIG
jgi:hypothetical protein